MMASRTDTGNDSHNTLLAMGTGMPGDTAGRRPPAWGFWAEGYGSLGQRRARDISSIYDYNTAGFVLGFDRKIAPSFLFGGTAGYSYTKVDLKDLSEDAKISSYQGSLYGIYTKGPWYASGIASYAYSAYDTTRDIAFGGLQRTASASYNGHLFAGYIEGGYKWKTKYADIIPLASFQAMYLLRGGFTEDGAGSLGLDADRENVASYLGSVGLRLRKDVFIKAGILSPELRLRWDHEFSNENHVLNASFTGYPQTAFTVRADRPDRDRFAAGVGLVLKTAGNVYLNLSYEGYFSNDTTRHSGMVGLQYRW
jgi:outer membrane autotransporter protein